MKRFVLLVLCVALMASCAWAGTLSAVYKYDGMDVEESSSKLQIEAMRDVKFTYTPANGETVESCTIIFSDDISLDMTSADGNFSCVYSFDAAWAGNEIGISMDATGFTPCSADIREGWGIEMEPHSLLLTTGQQTIIKFNNDEVANFEADDSVCPITFATFHYDDGDKGLHRSPRIMVTAGTSEGTKTFIVPFTNKWDSTKSFKRQCTITITNGDSGSGGGSGGGGGCDAGLAGLGVGLLALLSLAARKKR